MTPESALNTRAKMLKDGFCSIDDILTDEFLQELRDESERLIASSVQDPNMIYQGAHVVMQSANNDCIKRLLEWAPAHEALEQMGFGDFTSFGSVIILTKDPGEPALYWHQDWMQWYDPISAAGWPQQIFLNYYLQDTSAANGCLKVIPGTHLNRIPMHNELVPAHEQGARTIGYDHPVMFSEHPDQVDVCVKAGSLVLADARVLHAARANTTNARRTLILGWHSRPVGVPAFWDGEVPAGVLDRDPDVKYPLTRIPGEFLRG